MCKGVRGLRCRGQLSSGVFQYCMQARRDGDDICIGCKRGHQFRQVVKMLLCVAAIGRSEEGKGHLLGWSRWAGRRRSFGRAKESGLSQGLCRGDVCLNTITGADVSLKEAGVNRIVYRREGNAWSCCGNYAEQTLRVRQADRCRTLQLKLKSLTSLLSLTHEMSGPNLP